MAGEETFLVIYNLQERKVQCLTDKNYQRLIVLSK